MVSLLCNSWMPCSVEFNFLSRAGIGALYQRQADQQCHMKQAVILTPGKHRADMQSIMTLLDFESGTVSIDRWKRSLPECSASGNAVGEASSFEQYDKRNLAPSSFLQHKVRPNLILPR